MGELTLFDRIKDVLGSIGWRIFIWSLPMTEEAYFQTIYEQEAAQKKEESEPSTSDNKQSTPCPVCGVPWDMKKFNACSCGAVLKSNQHGAHLSYVGSK